jgi:hypothetical protein
MSAALTFEANLLLRNGAGAALDALRYAQLLRVDQLIVDGWTDADDIVRNARRLAGLFAEARDTAHRIESPFAPTKTRPAPSTEADAMRKIAHDALALNNTLAPRLVTALAIIRDYPKGAA